MIVEERIYTIQTGRVPEYLELYDRMGRALQIRILGNLLGYFQTEVGEPGSGLVHLWGYADAADRATRRAALAREPGWQEYLKACTPLILRIQNRLLIPTAFSPIR
jgi:hypothetical protein